MKEKLELQDIKEYQLLHLQQWSTIDKKMTEFINRATESTFIYLFGIEEGESLWVLYITQCQKDFAKFRRFLAGHEVYTLLVNAVYNEHLYRN